MGADGKADRMFLCPRRPSLVDAFEVGIGGDVGAAFATPSQRQTPHADIGEAGLRIDRIIDGRGDIGAAVELMLHVKRQQAGEVDVVALIDDALHRGFRARYIDDGLSVAHAAAVFLDNLVGTHAEGGGDALAAAAHAGDDLDVLRAGVLEQHGFAARFDMLRQIGERNRLVVGFDLAHLVELFDEAAEAEFVHVDVGHRGVSLEFRYTADIEAPKFDLVDLTHSAFRQFGHDLHLARHLVVADTDPAMLNQILSG